MINDMADNFIPSEKRSYFLAEVSFWLAKATYWLAVNGGLPLEGKKKAGEEAIELARQALEIHTQLYGSECAKIADDLMTLAGALDFFIDVDDDEIPRMYQQAISIYRRDQGSLSYNAAIIEYQLGESYGKRARRAKDANDLDRCMSNLELSLPRVNEAIRIFRAINHVDKVDKALRSIATIEEYIRQIGILQAAKAEVIASMRG